MTSIFKCLHPGRIAAWLSQMKSLKNNSNLKQLTGSPFASRKTYNRFIKL